MVLIPLGIAAGMLTTITGFGGGMLLVVALALVWDPLTAFTVTTMALLAGNMHRLALYRRDVSMPVLVPMAIGIVPGSLLGASLALAVPGVVLHGLMLTAALLSLVSYGMRLHWRVPRRALAPSGGVIGVMSATSGGVGPLMSQVILATGLSGDGYIATMAAAAVAIHIGRLSGYGLGGLVDARAAGYAAILAVALMVGNWLGRWTRGRLSAVQLGRLELAAPILCALLALIGLGG